MRPGLLARFQSQSADPFVERTLRKYRLGLVIIILFAVAMLVLTVVLASGAKQDAATQASATDVAAKLEEYINSNQQLPDSLVAAGIKNTPKAISYRRLSDSSYQFCVTYRAASDAGSTVTDVVGRGISGVSHAGSYETNSGDAAYPDPASPHKKGRNCQKISPYVVGADSTATAPADDTGSSDDSSTFPAGSDNNDSGTTPAPTSDPKDDAAKLGTADTACNIPGSYSTHYSGQVQSVDDDGNDLDNVVTVTIAVTSGTVSGTQTFTLSSDKFNVFDSTCADTLPNDFYQGDYVSVFQNSNKAGVKDTVVNSSL